MEPTEGGPASIDSLMTDRLMSERPHANGVAANWFGVIYDLIQRCPANLSPSYWFLTSGVKKKKSRHYTLRLSVFLWKCLIKDGGFKMSGLNLKIFSRHCISSCYYLVGTCYSRSTVAKKVFSPYNKNSRIIKSQHVSVGPQEHIFSVMSASSEMCNIKTVTLLINSLLCLLL